MGGVTGVRFEVCAEKARIVTPLCTVDSLEIGEGDDAKVEGEAREARRNAGLARLARRATLPRDS